ERESGFFPTKGRLFPPQGGDFQTGGRFRATKAGVFPPSGAKAIHLTEHGARAGRKRVLPGSRRRRREGRAPRGATEKVADAQESVGVGGSAALERPGPKPRPRGTPAVPVHGAV